LTDHASRHSRTDEPSTEQRDLRHVSGVAHALRRGKGYVRRTMIRPLREDEIDAAAQLMRVAYGREAPYVARLRRYLAIEPEGWFVIDEAPSKAFIGVVGMTLHGGSVGYVGLMAIRPDVQGRKLGRALMEHALGWARARGASRVMLDASEAGFPLYVR